MIKFILVLLMLSSPVLSAETICIEPNSTKHTIESVDGYDDLIIDGTYYYISNDSYETNELVVTLLDNGKSSTAFIVVHKKDQPKEDSVKSTLILSSENSESVSKCY